MTRHCYIHIGTHKTGTTSLQVFLRDNEEQFARNNVLIPKAGRSEDGVGHHNLTQQLIGAAGFVAERGGLDEFVDELRTSDKQVACISSEDFSLLSRSAEALTRLRDAVRTSGFTPVIVVYLRPQVSYCVSIYAEIVKNGNRKSFATYLDEIRQYGSFLWDGWPGPPCRYDFLLDCFSAVFGREAIIVRRYDGRAPSHALLRSFAELLIGSSIRHDNFVLPTKKFNPSFSFLSVLRTLGSDIHVKDMRFAPLSVRETLRLAAMFHSANVDVARRYGVWVLPVEFTDILLALPLRKTVERTRALRQARRMLRDMVIEDADVVTPNLSNTSF